MSRPCLPPAFLTIEAGLSCPSGGLCSACLTGPGLQKLPARFRCPLHLAAALPSYPQGSGPADRLCLLHMEQLRAFLGLFLGSWEPPASSSACEASGHRSCWAWQWPSGGTGLTPPRKEDSWTHVPGGRPPSPAFCSGGSAGVRAACPTTTPRLPPLSPACPGAPGSARVHFLDVLTVMWLKHRGSGHTAGWH